MDPFEVRMRFNSQLQHLNASVTSAQKAAVWAIKYREWDEDLHSCILENLERNSLNNRANIFYFFETLCDVAAAANHIEFVRMMERDILRIVDLVAPEDGSGAANVKVVRKVLRNLAGKKYLQQQTVDELEDCIKDRDHIGGVGGTASPEEAPRHSNGNVRVEKRQAEQRIEEDRERHKRLREGIWAVNEDEFDKTWAESVDVLHDDYRTATEEDTERTQYAGLHRTELLMT
jgi:CTD kinase subunit gamma